MFAYYGELDIFLATLEFRYMLISFAFDMDMCHLSPRRAYRVTEQHIEPKAISSDTKWHISMLKLLFVETNDRFDMACMRKHINALDLFYLIAVFSKGSKVAGEGFGVTGDIYNALWRKGDKTA